MLILYFKLHIYIYPVLGLPLLLSQKRNTKSFFVEMEDSDKTIATVIFYL